MRLDDAECLISFLPPQASAHVRLRVSLLNATHGRGHMVTNGMPAPLFCA